MTPISDMVERMLSEGAPAVAIVAAARAVETAGRALQRVARAVPASRGMRLPEGWRPSDTIAEEMIGPSRSVMELAKFRDYWKQQPGQKGVKLDWDATWRNWVRRAAENNPRNGVLPSRPLTQHQIEREESRKILDELNQYASGGVSQPDFGFLRLDTGDRQESVYGRPGRDALELSPNRSPKGG